MKREHGRVSTCYRMCFITILCKHFKPVWCLWRQSIKVKCCCLFVNIKISWGIVWLKQSNDDSSAFVARWCLCPFNTYTCVRFLLNNDSRRAVIWKIKILSRNLSEDFASPIIDLQNKILIWFLLQHYKEYFTYIAGCHPVCQLSQTEKVQQHN